VQDLGDGQARSTKDGLVFISGVMPTDASAGVPQRMRPTELHDADALRGQTALALAHVGRMLEAGGSAFDRVVKAEVFLTDLRLLDAFDDIWRSMVPTLPPRTLIEVGAQGMLAAGAMVQIDLIATRIDSANQPVMFRGNEPPEHDALACQIGDLVWIGGLSAVQPGTTSIQPEAQLDPDFPFNGSAIERQTDVLLSRLTGILADIGSERGHVAKAQVFLTDLRDFHGFHEVWRSYFGSTPPSTTVQVGGLRSPDARCEIELVASRAAGERALRSVARESGPRPLKHAQGSVVGTLALPAGHVATDFVNGVAPEARVDARFPFYGSDIERQTEYTLDYLEAVLVRSGSSLDDTLRAQVFMRDLADYYGFDKIWRRRFASPPPRSVVPVSGHGLLTPGTLVEIDLIASADPAASMRQYG
jgi:enamine deaminase RidA (YjgF/YER057c/UK114 family)